MFCCRIMQATDGKPAPERGAPSILARVRALEERVPALAARVGNRPPLPAEPPAATLLSRVEALEAAVGTLLALQVLCSLSCGLQPALRSPTKCMEYVYLMGGFHSRHFSLTAVRWGCGTELVRNCRGLRCEATEAACAIRAGCILCPSPRLRGMGPGKPSLGLHG